MSIVASRRRRTRRQDDDHGAHDGVACADVESVGSHAHTGRLFIGFGGGRGRLYAANRNGKPGARLRDPARVDLRRHRPQTDVRRAQPAWRRRSESQSQPSRPAWRHADGRLGSRPSHRPGRRTGPRLPATGGSRQASAGARAGKACAAIHVRLGEDRRAVAGCVRTTAHGVALTRHRNRRARADPELDAYEAATTATPEFFFDILAWELRWPLRPMSETRPDAVSAGVRGYIERAGQLTVSDYGSALARRDRLRRNIARSRAASMRSSRWPISARGRKGIRPSGPPGTTTRPRRSARRR